MSEKRSFEVVVEGQYHALHDSGNTALKRYRAVFTLPSCEAALSVICRHLLNPYLVKNYPDYIRYRTHELKSITVIGRKPNTEVLQMGIEEMSMDQLSDFCILRQLLIDPYKHSDLTKCRESVMEAWRIKRQAQIDKQTNMAAQEDEAANALRAANNLPAKSEEVAVNINEQKATRQMSNAPQKASVTASVGPTGRDRDSGVEEDAPLPPIENDNTVGSASEII